MYSSSITGPLVVGSTLHLSTADTAYLVSCDLLSCGLVTILQCLGFGPVGVRMPVMMGVTFAAIGPAVAIGSNPSLGLPGIFGSVIVSGAVGMLLAPWFSRCMRLFTPVVTGSTLLLIGVTLSGVAVRWIAGPDPSGTGDFHSIAIGFFVVVCILALIRFGRGVLANMAVLIGIVAGFVVSSMTHPVHFGEVSSAPWFRLVRPMHFGMPRFDPAAAASMSIVMLVTMVESTGMFFALSNMVERPMGSQELARALRADAAGGLIGGFFNSLPMTSYSQNMAIVAITGVKSRFVCVAAGCLLLVLGTMPKLAFLVTTIPLPVLGGAALVMFGMVAASGIQIISRADLVGNRKNLYVIATGLCVGLIPVMDPNFFHHFPGWSGPFLHSGILLGTVTFVLMNLLLNGFSDGIPSGGRDLVTDDKFFQTMSPDRAPVATTELS